MNMLKMVRSKMNQARSKHKLHTQAKAELKARDLEEKAKYSKELRQRLERQDKARAEIDKVKQIRQARTRKVLQHLKKTQAKIKKAGNSSPGPQFGLGGGSSGGPQFGLGPSSNGPEFGLSKNKKKKGPKFGL